ncbi:Undecaprenyl-phosphate 4-deoxy-4-formamido-L-arabinose transferase [Stieleria maiorica]|uniref:Undecaprenyl-phosphate 4-deoxy-4-formamido-L-arabinose transferase n=1 Tax=Stieleria maiorica TaxID=2795974 RepID=A0A5B9MEW3_9BACT|nr:glycosyltransferase family 2 protein [Stieleria maiorica]QEF99638.1 Undecaprenyl-phosphate 4-deoxy-4-formamido-L-arabinose transferase [Stieleria maiorica]
MKTEQLNSDLTAANTESDRDGGDDRGLELSVVMPCLNEAETLQICIEKSLDTMQAHGIDGEVVIADNGSTDGSQEIARRSGARVVPVESKGYGSALRGGIAAAKGKFVIMGDADDSYDFTHIPRILEKLRDGNDLVMGNRFKGGIEPGAMPPLHRYLGNPVLSGIGRLFFSAPCGDFHCGLRGFRQDLVERLDLRTTGMEFASEMVVKSTLHKVRIAEVPTTLSPDGRSRAPHLRSFRDGWRHLRFMMLYSPRWLFLYPGLLVFLIGVVGMLWLLPGSRFVGNIVLDINTLLYAAGAVLIGFQAVLFSVLTKVFAVTSGLIPKPVSWEKWFQIAKLETGLILGGVLMVGGVIGSVFAVTQWGQESFGELDPSQMMRLVIPSVLAMALGCQIALFSFFFSVLGLARD